MLLVEDQIQNELLRYRAQLADRLKSVDHEYSAKGLFKSGPRIRASQAAMAEQFTDLAKRLLVFADLQADLNAADDKVMATLRDEHSNLRRRLREVVDSTGDSNAARTAADELMDRALEEVEQLASIPRVARSSSPGGYGQGYGLDYGGASDSPEDRREALEIVPDAAPSGAIELSDSLQGEIISRSARWTGNPSQAARLVAVHGQLEIAQSAVGYLIDELADTEGNAGPLLDEHADALEALRGLHRALGDLLEAVDRGTLNDELGEGLAAEIARYGGRAVETLRNDPSRFVLSATIFALLSACGLGDLGGFLAGAAASIKKKAQRPR